MKKFLLSFLTLLMFQTLWAQTLTTTTFDFKSDAAMQTYTWSPKAYSSNGGSYSDNTVTNGNVTLKFVKSGSYGVLLQLDGNEKLAGMACTTNSLIIVSVPSGSTLQSIQFDGSGVMGFPDGEPGNPVDSPTGPMFWTADSITPTPTNSVTFFAGSGTLSYALITKVIVTYTKPSTPLTFVSTSPSNGQTVNTFSSIQLNFNTKISSKLKNDGVTLKYPDGSTKTLSLGSTGNYSMVASLSGTALGKDGKTGDDGEYTVNVAAGSFQNSEGSQNQAYSTKFNVYAKRDILSYKNYPTTSGAQLDVIKVVFNEQIKVDVSKNPTVKLNGSTKGPLTLSVDPDDVTQKTVLMTAEAPFVELGDYTIEVPVGAIRTTFYGSSTEAENDRWNSAFTLSYNVYREESQAMQEARALLQKSGIGYPATTSAAYVNLKAAVEAVDGGGSEDGLTDLIAAYKAETNVTLPTSGSYYKVAKGTAYYAYSNGTLSTTTSVSGAYSFLATKNGDGTYTLKTTEATGNPSKYLVAGAISETAANLTLAKGSQLGTLSISGFTGDYTFTAGSQPSTPIDPSSTLTPSFSFQSPYIANAGDELLLVVSYSGTVNVNTVISENAKPYFTTSDEAGNMKTVTFNDVILTPNSNYSYKFNVNTTGLSKGTYLLWLPKGTFVYTSSVTVVDRDINGIQFVIQNGGTTPVDPTPEDPTPEDPTPTTTVTPTLKLSATTISKPGDVITITLGNVDKAVLKNSTYPTLTSSSNVTSSAKLTSSGNTTFKLNTSALAAGTSYTLTLPTNTFTYTKSGATVNDVELKATFSIQKGTTPSGDDTGLTISNPDDAHKYTGYNIFRANYHQGDALADVDLNELYIYVYETISPYSIVANPDVEIEIDGSVPRGINAKRYYGHFESCPEFATKFGLEGTKAIKLVMDNPILAGELDYYKGIYSYNIPAGAFGDENFGKYLKKNSLGLSNCKWNAENPTGIHYPVDNVVANTKNLSEEVREKAIAVVNAVGAGYPSESKSARVALKELVKNGMGDDAQWEAALQEVYKITDVEAPVSHDYYKVEAVASNGESAWITYNGSQLLLTKDGSKATALRITREAGYYSLETGDGKFVATLDQLVPTYDPTICAFTIAKLPQIGGASYEQTYGLMSLHGPAGYMVADVSSLTFGAPTSSVNTFNTTKTNGFRLTDVIVGDIVAPEIDVTLTPAPGNVSKLSTVSLSFNGISGIKVANPNLIYLQSTSKIIQASNVTGVAGTYGDFVMTFPGVEDDTEYDLIIPSGSFAFTFAGTNRQVSSIRAHYYVHNVPLTTEELQLAQSLLNMKGIGYPQTLSAGRKALQAVVDNSAATNADFDEAVAAYYAETKVTLPENGKWYKIAATASDKTAAWLQYDGTKIIPVRDAAKAAAFQVTTIDGAFNFITVDGKRLRLMKQLETDGTVATNLTATYNESLNGMMLEKLPVANTLGLLAISGSLDGKTDAFAQVNVPQSVFTTAPEVAPVYTETLTNAFTFLEVSPTDLPVIAVNIEFNMNDSTELESLTQVELTLTTSEVNLKDQNLITLTDEDGKAYTVAGVTKKTGTNNAYVITFGELPLDNTYTLNVANGAFTFAYAGNTYDVDGAKLTCIVLPQRAASQDVENAKNLLKKSGLGYPASKSASRTLLKAFTTSGRPTAKEYASVVEAFYNETDIEKPIAGRYYVLSAIASDGAQAWLAYDGKELSLTNDVTKATGLKVTDNKNGTYQLILGNGKFLATLDTTTDSYDNETNAQTIGRFPTKDIDPIRTFGLFSLKNGGGYATVDMKEMKVLPSSETAVYGADVTNAFRFAVTSKESIAAPQPTVTFDPEDGAKLDKIRYVNVTFSDHAPVSLLDRQNVILTNGTDTIKPSMIDSYDEKPNFFTISFSNVPVGYYYTMVIDEGTFGYMFADSLYSIPKLTVGYNVKEPEATPQQKKEAIQLLAKTGLGCPTATSAARLRLNELIEGGGTITEFKLAIEAYKNDDDVEKPVSGQYYFISAVGSSGKVLYVVTDGLGVSLTADEKTATPFKMNIHDNGTFSFETEGKFLKQMKQTSLVSGLTESYIVEENDLFVNRLILEDHSYEETMGYFCISDAAGIYALVDVKEGTFMTNSSLELAYFDEDWTNGFVFTKTDAPIPDAINGITVDAADEPVFDLQGRRVTGALKRGQLYVKGGRKFVAK